MKIVPAILTDRLETLRESLNAAQAFTDYVQIDFMDGQFVPSKSVSPKNLDGLSATLACEAHMMVKDPAQYLNDLRSFGFKRVIFHYEAESHPEPVIQTIKAQGMEAGVALNPETDISVLEGLVSELDSVLFLSVQPGFYGSPFVESVLQKIERFRPRYPDLEIGLDGGVGVDNISRIKTVGVNYACVGSRIFLSENPARSYKELEKKARAT